jgi:hypothetical protein
MLLASKKRLEVRLSHMAIAVAEKSPTSEAGVKVEKGKV